VLHAHPAAALCEDPALWTLLESSAQGQVAGSAGRAQRAEAEGGWCSGCHVARGGGRRKPPSRCDGPVCAPLSEMRIVRADTRPTHPATSEARLLMNRVSLLLGAASASHDSASR